MTPSPPDAFGEQGGPIVNNCSLLLEALTTMRKFAFLERDVSKMYLLLAACWQSVEYHLTFSWQLRSVVWTWYFDVLTPSRATELCGACLVLALNLTSHLPVCLASALSDALGPLKCVELFAPRLNGPTWLCCSAWWFSSVLSCDCLYFLRSPLILVSDYLLPQWSDHLSSVFALLIMTLAKIRVTNEIRYL